MTVCERLLMSVCMHAHTCVGLHAYVCMFQTIIKVENEDAKIVETYSYLIGISRVDGCAGGRTGGWEQGWAVP